MSHVGVLLCDCQGAYSGLINPGRFRSDMFSQEEVVISKRLCDPDELVKISSDMRRRGIERLVIGACALDAARNDIGVPLLKDGWPAPYLSFVPLRDMAAALAADNERALRTMNLAIRRGIERVLARESKGAPYEKPCRRVAVIGGGATGLMLTKRLEALNIPVLVIEKDADLGGYLKEASSLVREDGSVSLKAVSTLRKKLVEDLAKSAAASRMKAPPAASQAGTSVGSQAEASGIPRSLPSEDSMIDIRTSTTVTRIAGGPGRYKITLQRGEEPGGEEEVGALALATGFRTEFRPEDHGLEKTRSATAGKGPVLYSMKGLETELLKDTFDNLERLRGKKVAFITDVSTENSKCFTVSGLKNAIYLQKELACEVYFLARDAKVAGAGLESLYGAARRAGVVFLKREGSKPAISLASGEGKSGRKVQIRQLLPSLGDRFSTEPVNIEVDVICLDERLMPQLGDMELCESLGIGAGRHTKSDAISWRPGMKPELTTLARFQEENVRLYPVKTAREGVWVVGGARGDRDFHESALDAMAAAEEIKKWLDHCEARAAFGRYFAGVSEDGNGAPKPGVSGDIGKSGLRLLRNGWQSLLWAQVEDNKCARCLTCVRLCPHGAIKVPEFGISERKAAEVDVMACRGCGICASACPGRAITLVGCSDEEVFAELSVMGEYA